jgi:hypothetical protein
VGPHSHSFTFLYTANADELSCDVFVIVVREILTKTRTLGKSAVLKTDRWPDMQN